MKIALIFLIIIAQLFASTNITVDSDTNLLIDEHGQFRIFHGVNVVYKIAPFYPTYDSQFDPLNSFNQLDVQNLVKWGFNVVRLYIAWEGVEPEEQIYSQDYINHIKNIVEMLEKYNIYVFLDMHQDLYSRYFCGEGLPSWAVESQIKVQDQSFPKPQNIELTKDKEGYPNLDECNKTHFFKFYNTYDVQKIAQDLFTNVGGLTDKFANFWEYVAKNFKNYDNLLGYEIINEPTGFNIYETPFYKLLPGTQNNEALLPFYQAINKKIRGVDKESLVFFEPIVGDFLNSGFKTNLGGPQYKNREVFSYHIYCQFVNTNGEPKSQLGCSIYDKYFSNGKEKNYQKIGVAGFLTEFGALDNTEGSAQEVDRVTGNADKIFNSWTYWQYKYFHDITTAAKSPDVEGFWNSKGELQSIKVGALSRCYAYQICGNPIEMTWKRHSQRFTLQYQINRY